MKSLAAGGSMAIPRNIKQYLFHNNVTYSHKIHPVAYTSQEVAEVEHVPGAEFAKTVVLQADERMILAALPGDQVINLDVLKRQIPCGKLTLIPEKEFIEKFSTCQPGAMPPLGKLFGLPLYCDSGLAKLAEIEFNAGTHIDTIQMTYANFVKLESPIVAGFAERRTSEPVARTA
jgi:Ala-tRNA(Pro) deacylase